MTKAMFFMEMVCVLLGLILATKGIFFEGTTTSMALGTICAFLAGFLLGLSILTLYISGWDND